MPGYASSIAYNFTYIPGGFYANVLQATRFVWKDSLGKSPVSSYRVHVSWAGDAIAESLLWYLELVNDTKSETYTGSVYDTNAPAVTTPAVDYFTYTYSISGSYMDIFRNVGVRNDDNIYANLYLRGSYSGGSFSNYFRCAITIEPIGYISAFAPA
jgi:hypothetical protein